MPSQGAMTRQANPSFKILSNITQSKPASRPSSGSSASIQTKSTSRPSASSSSSDYSTALLVILSLALVVFRYSHVGAQTPTYLAYLFHEPVASFLALLTCALLLFFGLWFTLVPATSSLRSQHVVVLSLTLLVLISIIGRLPGNVTVPIFKVNLFDADECREMIRAAEIYAEKSGGWQSKRHSNFPTEDISITDDIPYFKTSVMHKINSKLIPLMQTIAYRDDITKPGTVIPENQLRAASQVQGQDQDQQHNQQSLGTVKPVDIFIIRYTDQGQPGLQSHMDTGHLTANVMLSDPQEQFTGGGTHYDLLNHTLHVGQGQALISHANLWHHGKNTTSGIRYILVVFSQLHPKPFLESPRQWLETKVFNAWGIFAKKLDVVEVV